MKSLNEDEILANLNEEQRRGVTHGEGPLLIVAGAGTGKTTVLTRRIAWLIASKKARPEECLALAFNERAAAEMEERVDRLVPYGYAPVQMLTFHAFGDRLLKDHALRLGLSPDAQVLSGATLRLFLRERLFKLPLERFRPLARPDSHIGELIKLFSRAKDEAITPQAYLESAQALLARCQAHPDERELAEEAADQMELARAYGAFDDMLHQEGFLDHGDQVFLALRLLQDHPAVLARVRQACRWIVVDEFQDTNTAQFQLLRLLAPGQANLTVVGDDDQAIYRFRGASLANILEFRKTYPDSAAVVLKENYRSTQEMLDIAHRLIQSNNPERLEAKEKLDKRLKAQADRSKAQSVFLSPFDRSSTEADFIAASIQERVAAGKNAWKDFAVLVRGNAQAEPVLEAFRFRGLPWRFTGARGLYQQSEVKLCLAFLRCLANPSDSISLFELLTSELYRTPLSDLKVLLNLSKVRNRSLYSVLTRTELGRDGEELDLDPEAWESASKALKDLQRFGDKALKQGVAETLYEFLSDTGFVRKLMKNQDDKAERRLGNLARFLDRARDFDRQDMPLPQVAAYLEDLIAEGDNPPASEADLEADCVTVSSVHSAKGLEWPVVFLAGLEEGHFPGRNRADQLSLPEALFPAQGDAKLIHRAEERRLFYVALTRAREELRLSYSRDHGGKQAWKRSGFLQEAFDLPKEEPAAGKLSAQERLSRHSPRQEHPLLSPAAPLPPDAPLKLSYYPIDDYLTCPLKYKFIHVLKLKAPLTHSIVYGKAMHHAVQSYHRARMENLPFGLEQLKAAFREEWQAEGFHSREHEDERLKHGDLMLEKFYAEQEASKVQPWWIEKPFTASLPGRNRLDGRMDRVDKDGQGKVTICDYKTSNVHDQKKADEEVSKSLQLAIYALGFKETEGKLPETLKLHFLESGLQAELHPNEEYLKDKLDEVESAFEGIRAGAYDPKPDFMACKFCNFSRICPSSAVE
jgi:DNA helicase-2/ATP-dependent DNA helicase PcrA